MSAANANVIRWLSNYCDENRKYMQLPDYQSTNPKYGMTGSLCHLCCVAENIVQWPIIQMIGGDPKITMRLLWLSNADALYDVFYNKCSTLCDWLILQNASNISIKDTIERDVLFHFMLWIIASFAYCQLIFSGNVFLCGTGLHRGNAMYSYITGILADKY